MRERESEIDIINGECVERERGNEAQRRIDREKSKHDEGGVRTRDRGPDKQTIMWER